jgi:hypothetical protein
MDARSGDRWLKGRQAGARKSAPHGFRDNKDTILDPMARYREAVLCAAW